MYFHKYYFFQNFLFILFSQVGKAQAENNGILDQNEKSNGNNFDPLGVSDNESSILPSTPDHVGDKSTAATEDKTPLKRMSSGSLPSTPKHNRTQFETPSPGFSTPSHDKSDLDIDVDAGIKLDNVSHENLIHMFKKQEKTLGRYKLRFSEVSRFSFCEMFLRKVLFLFEESF